ncbi:pentatricopeptide repeat-containing protein At4g18840-like isoform X1 [Selaginella moellendorffii]|uniref:pentatricopeptide repeat-containing protein At4g18840-like isoform X1 n=1 Tax=Selaginella moellendorffii TaxID=88036 RepID=UPI000D1CD7E3|nr:pentatricopeptide repeat-containing protein At4g18840-like isoform X1 [Selaginella moellendorffii]XP_024539575.1 pentatricopeptide repeat-containing protein At4g18840-like isoform X1 [Selaginella moellendorffii]XP_024539576.1 pentatricopeptide repeat-containing protein At4g18840-like isoform X1 [Selaginella moellendorffii]|eukprot:XP_024539574.1 pentatricopeptide repeat-containing protein At4g18840-like isoform X1 [Selaginella moellendorffii]
MAYEALRNNFIIEPVKPATAFKVEIATDTAARVRFASNGKIKMYGKLSRVKDARQVFDRMRNKDSVSWFLMLAVYAQNGHMEEAKLMFSQMPERSLISFNMMLSSFGRCGCVQEAYKIFNNMPHRDLVSWNAVTFAYAHNGYINETVQVFDAMPERDMICMRIIEIWKKLRTSLRKCQKEI